MNVEIKTEKEYIDVKTLSEFVPEIKELCDPSPVERATIKLSNTFPEFVAMLRRCLIGEMEVKVMVAEDIECNDERVFKTLVIDKIRQIPISQDKDYDNISFSLNVTNGTAENMKIMSSHLKASNDKPIITYFSDLFSLCVLHPGHSIKISNIEVESGIAKGSEYCYKMIGGNPTQQGDESKIIMTVQNCRRTPIKYILEQLYKTLFQRLDNIREIIDDMRVDSDEKRPEFKFHGEVQYYNNSFVFIDESTTIPICLQRYIMDLDKTIQVKVYPSTHPEKRNTNLEIGSDNDLTLLKKAINLCITDLKKFYSAVTKIK